MSNMQSGKATSLLDCWSLVKGQETSYGDLELVFRIGDQLVVKRVDQMVDIKYRPAVSKQKSS